MSDQPTEPNGITRRDLLKRGAILGGALAWATPVVQVVGISRAHARPPSPGCIRYCLKWEADRNEPILDPDTGGFVRPCDGVPEWDVLWTSNFVALGGDKEDGEGSPGNCLVCDQDFVNDNGAASDLAERQEFQVYGDRSMGFWVAYPQDCTLAPIADEGRDPIASKCGAPGGGDCNPQPGSEVEDPCFTDSEGNPYKRVFFATCSDGTDFEISHLELILDCCE